MALVTPGLGPHCIRLVGRAPPGPLSLPRELQGMLQAHQFGHEGGPSEAHQEFDRESPLAPGGEKQRVSRVGWAGLGGRIRPRP